MKTLINRGLGLQCASRSYHKEIKKKEIKMMSKVEFDYTNEKEKLDKHIKERMDHLEWRRRWSNRIQTAEFSHPIRFGFNEFMKDITVWMDMSFSEDEVRRTIAELVSFFGVRLERKFDSWTGRFYWFAPQHWKSNEENDSFWLYVRDIPAPGCRIYKVKEQREVEVWKSECAGEKEVTNNATA